MAYSKALFNASKHAVKLPFTKDWTIPLKTNASDYGFEIRAHQGRAVAIVDGIKIAETDRALILTETHHTPVFYFPRVDVRLDLLEPSVLRTHCPFRGNASYWSLPLNTHTLKNLAWSYEQPFFDARRIKGHIAFYQERLDQFLVDEAPPPVPSVASLSYTNPLIDWLLRRAPQATSIRELIEQFANTLLQADIPLWRLWLNVRTLHPLLVAFSYEWDTENRDAVELQVDRGAVPSDAYLMSPVRLILEGAGGVRCRLEGPNPQLDYPIVREHHQAGATDYVAMPLVFSDEQINAITFTSKRKGGFSSRDLGFVYEVLPTFARLVEVHAAQRKSIQLLRTYLGRYTGERVLNGQITRGDRERIHAVIWFCDLRDSTGLADRLPGDVFLHTLNRFYDCVAGAVLDHGGEVLRFIGDAALAIFPISSVIEQGRDPERTAPEVCASALSAAINAKSRIEQENIARSEEGNPPLSYGIALHVGDVTYGNIGTAERLEFTVVGSAANEAARIEGLTKTLGYPILFSDTFTFLSENNRYLSLGRHQLRGLSEPRELFALSES